MDARIATSQQLIVRQIAALRERKHPGTKVRPAWFLLAYEETGVDFCATLGGVAGRSPSRYVEWSTTDGWSGRPVSNDASPNDRRLLHRGNDRNVLQRTYWPKHEWLRVEGGVHIEQRVHIQWRVRIEQRCRWRH
jgi:hypothetical protein